MMNHVGCILIMMEITLHNFQELGVIGVIRGICVEELPTFVILHSKLMKILQSVYQKVVVVIV